MILGRLAHPAGIKTLAMTGQNFRMPTVQLARSLQLQNGHLDVKRRDAFMVLLALDVVFADGVATDNAAAAVERIERAIRERFPKITRIYIESRNRIDLPAAPG